MSAHRIQPADVDEGDVHAETSQTLTLKHPHLGGDEGDGGAVDDIDTLQARGHDLAQLVPAVRLEALPPPRQPASHDSNQV